MTEEIINSDGSRNWQANILLDNVKRLEQERESLYEEKNCLHKIIDRLLENAGYSKNIASAEDFEDVYEDMQIKRNKLIELEQENKQMKSVLKEIKIDVSTDCSYYKDVVKNEIYIDGVNVAGCEYYHKDDSICDNKNNHNVGCGQYDTCTYKQLKRLEQENKELKGKIESRENELANMAEQANMRINNYRSALKEIREIEELAYYSKGMPEEPLSQRDFILDAINNYEQRRIKILNKINEVLDE